MVPRHGAPNRRERCNARQSGARAPDSVPLASVRVFTPSIASLAALLPPPPHVRISLPLRDRGSSYSGASRSGLPFCSGHWGSLRQWRLPSHAQRLEWRRRRSPSDSRRSMPVRRAPRLRSRTSRTSIAGSARGCAMRGGDLTARWSTSAGLRRRARATILRATLVARGPRRGDRRRRCPTRWCGRSPQRRSHGVATASSRRGSRRGAWWCGITSHARSQFASWPRGRGRRGTSACRRTEAPSTSCSARTSTDGLRIGLGASLDDGRATRSPARRRRRVAGSRRNSRSCSTCCASARRSALAPSRGRSCAMHRRRSSSRSTPASWRTRSSHPMGVPHGPHGDRGDPRAGDALHGLRHRIGLLGGQECARQGGGSARGAATRRHPGAARTPGGQRAGAMAFTS